MKSQMTEEQKHEQALANWKAPVDYPTMIQQLFKGMPGTYDNHMHAAVGIMGEVGELHESPSRDNVIEEGGDLSFYIQAYINTLVSMGHEAAVLKYMQVTVDTHGMHLGTVLTQMVIVSGQLLDLTKKSWVYGRDLDIKEVVLRLSAMADLTASLFKLVGTTTEEVQYLNQRKLIGPGGRFESGFYSDAAAIARADKCPGIPASRS